MEQRTLRPSKQVHLGVGTIFCDVAGWVQENPDNPIVTIAAVAMPPERVKKRRAELINSFEHAPLKWKKGGLRGWERITPILVRPEVHVAVSQVHRAGAAWEQFYIQGREFARVAAPSWARFRDISRRTTSCG
jgi:hypothetical protein